MPEIIDILTTDPGTGGEFTVNIAATAVNITPTAGLPRLKSSDGNYLFQRGDNFILLSAGIFVPESFVLANQTVVSLPSIELSAQRSNATPILPVKAVGNSGEVFIPFINYETSLGVYVDTEVEGYDFSFWLEALIPATGPNYPKISMTNVPAAFDGLDFEVTPFVKVLHNFPLTT